MPCINTANGLVLSTKVATAKDCTARMKGLLGRDNLPAEESLLIDHCCQIHTFFMRFTIDAVFLNRENRVLKVITGMRPWRISPWVLGATKVLELADGATAGKVSPGDILKIEC